MCHIQRKTVSILTIPHIYLDLAPPLSEKIRNWLTPHPPLTPNFAHPKPYIVKPSEPIIEENLNECYIGKVNKNIKKKL